MSGGALSSAVCDMPYINNYFLLLSLPWKVGVHVCVILLKCILYKESCGIYILTS